MLTGGHFSVILDLQNKKSRQGGTKTKNKNMAAVKRPRKSSKKVAVHPAWGVLAAAFPEKQDALTSLWFGTFLFLFASFMSIVPAAAWSPALDSAVEVGDAVGRGFEKVMVRMEHEFSFVVLAAETTSFPESVSGRGSPLTAEAVRKAAVYAVSYVRSNFPRSLPAPVRGGNGSPATTARGTLGSLKTNFRLNTATLIQSYTGRPEYLQKSLFLGLRRYRRQIPLQWNARSGEPAIADAS